MTQLLSVPTGCSNGSFNKRRVYASLVHVEQFFQGKSVSEAQTQNQL